MNSIQQGATDLSVANAATRGQGQVVSTPFYCMGVSRQKLFFFVKQTNSPLSLSITRLQAPWVYALAPLSYWQAKFPTDDRRCLDGVRWRNVADYLIRECYEIGEYQGVPEFMKTLKKGAK